MLPKCHLNAAKIYIYHLYFIFTSRSHDFGTVLDEPDQWVQDDFRQVSHVYSDFFRQKAAAEKKRKMKKRKKFH